MAIGDHDQLVEFEAIPNFADSHVWDNTVYTKSDIVTVGHQFNARHKSELQAEVGESLIVVQPNGKKTIIPAGLRS